MQAFERHHHFREGRENVEDDKRSGSPQISRTAENTDVSAVRENGLQTIAELVGISSATCRLILTTNLNMHRVCQHIVPCMLNDLQVKLKVHHRLNERTWLKMDSRNVSLTFTSHGKRV
ncbi:hypothetical protein TNCV_4406991 [Trichonephila clavipes]|nr:hypothetical protein TNCV_4406991 [Trichonephila clavipes]